MPKASLFFIIKLEYLQGSASAHIGIIVRSQARSNSTVWLLPRLAVVSFLALLGTSQHAPPFEP